MDAHYMYPSAFDASSPDSVSPPDSSVSAPSPEFVFAHDTPSPGFSSELDMLHPHSQNIQHYETHSHSDTSANNYAYPNTLSTGHYYNDSHSPGVEPSPSTDFAFANTLRAIRGTRSSSYDQGQGEGSNASHGDEGPEEPTESEAAVAETIVRARKSWKTIKGRTEAVWPPHLEKTLVQALLQYKPHDSRYARALGRFPKRNRYISDYIYQTTGVRRTPKQVGSRLQQLKDVSCGKMLLNHVASWSLATAPGTSTASYNETVSPSSIHPNLNVIINGAHGHGSEGSQSPVSPLASGGAFARLELSATEKEMKPFNPHSSIYPTAAVGGQTLGALYQQPSAPSSPFDSASFTPMVRNMDVFIPFDPAKEGIKTEGNDMGCPLVQFGGCLARPDTVFAPQPVDPGRSSGWLKNRVTFLARDPIAAQSVACVWFDGSNALPSPSTTATYGREQTAKSSGVLVHEHSEPLICTQTPAVRVSAAQTSFYSVDNITLRKDGGDDRDCFVYATNLLDDSMWRALRRAGAGLKRYTITQDLMHSFDSVGISRGEKFLSITYHFVPISTSACSAAHTASFSTLSPLDTRGYVYAQGRGYRPVSPVSSDTPSPISASPSSFTYSRRGSGMQGDGHDDYAINSSHLGGHPHAQVRVPQVSVQPPASSSISQTGELLNSFDQDGCYITGMNSSAISEYNVDFNELNIESMHLSASVNTNTNTGFDHPQMYL